MSRQLLPKIKSVFVRVPSVPSISLKELGQLFQIYQLFLQTYQKCSRLEFLRLSESYQGRSRVDSAFLPIGNLWTQRQEGNGPNKCALLMFSKHIRGKD